MFSSSAFAANCTDSDGGANYYLKGTLSLSNGTTYTDSCQGNSVHDYYCASNAQGFLESYYNCRTDVCSDGACVNSSTPVCTNFTYSAWGSCVGGVQTRTVLSSSPSGCTGGSPVTSQTCAITSEACTDYGKYVVISNSTNTNFTYYDFCTSAGSLRTYSCVYSNSSSVFTNDAFCVNGYTCFNGACVSVNSSTPLCNSFTYSSWGSCVNGTQTRTVLSSSPANCTGGSPVLTQACTVPVTPVYSCDLSNYCKDSDGTNYYNAGTVVWVNLNNKGNELNVSTDSCSGNTVVEYVCDESITAKTTYTCPYGCYAGACMTSSNPVCTNFTYTSWSPCIDSVQTRDIASSSPAGCTGGSPVLSQTCTVSGSQLTATLISTTDDKAGQFLVFRGDGRTDWAWQAALTVTSQKTISSMKVIATSAPGEFYEEWTTLSSSRWPLVVYYVNGSASTQLNTYYGQSLGTYPAGTYKFNLYGNKAMSYFRGGVLYVSFTDGSTLSAFLPSYGSATTGAIIADTEPLPSLIAKALGMGQ